MAKDEESGGPVDVQPSVALPAQKIELHPAFYVSYSTSLEARHLIFLEFGYSSVAQSSYSTSGFLILLDSVLFLKLDLLLTWRISDLFDNVAFGLCNNMYPNSCANDNSPRWSENRQDGRENLPSCHRSNRRVLQSLTHLLKSSIPLLVRCVHPNAQGRQCYD
jgi:hypothetical protein